MRLKRLGRRDCTRALLPPEMSESLQTLHLHPPLKEWVLVHVSGNFKEVLRLTMKESKSDPPEDPFRSLYAARELLVSLMARFDDCLEEHLRTHEDFKVLLSNIQLELGLNYINTEELSRGEQLLETCLGQLDGLPSKVKTAAVSIQALNQLGILWGNRDEQQKALECLLKSKAVYESHVALPPPITDSQWLVCEEVDESEREKAFESHHTMTLFYLAQVYGNLKQPRLSAQYCQTTLSRQLEAGEYDAIEWSLNCATLSQFHMSSGNFAQSRHCLAAASEIFHQHKAEKCASSTSATTGEAEGPPDSRLDERMNQTEADISRCWTKYCISLLSTEEEEGPEQSKPKLKLFKFDSLDVSDIEFSIPCDLIKSYEEAKPAFLACQKHIEISKQYYTLENYASEHVLIVQDHSNAYKLLAHFATAHEIKCRMHKRRTDMLMALQQELNPQYYLGEHRQIMYEVAETQNEMAGLKIISASDAPTPHAVGKINKLLQSAIHYFEQFIASFHDPGTRKLPDCIDQDYLRSILYGKLNIARLYSKLISPDPNIQVRIFLSLSVFEACSCTFIRS